MKLLQINNVLRTSTSTGRIVREIGDLAVGRGNQSYIAYSRGRDGKLSCSSETLPVGNAVSVAWHGIVTRLTDRHGLASSAATRKLIRQMRVIGPDIVHLHNINGYFLDYRLLFRYLAESGIPVVWTVHDSWLYTGHCYYYSSIGCTKWQTGCGKCPQRKAFPSSLLIDRSRRNWLDKKKAFTSLCKDRMTVVAVSEWMKGELEKSFMKDYDIRVIRNGIDTSVFAPSGDRDRIRKRLGLGQKKTILGVAGIWSREKGLDDFIRMASLLDKDEAIILAGVDDAQKKILPENIIGIPRTSDAGTLAEIYSAADVFVNPTWQDNYPTVNLEAQSCGTPVVTYDTGGSPESVCSAAGAVRPKGDVPGLLDAARKLISRGKEYNGNICRRFATDNFRKQDRYADYFRLYGSFVDKKI